MWSSKQYARGVVIEAALVLICLISLFWNPFARTEGLETSLTKLLIQTFCLVCIYACRSVFVCLPLPFSQTRFEQGAA